MKLRTQNYNNKLDNLRERNRNTKAIQDTERYVSKSNYRRKVTMPINRQIQYPFFKNKTRTSVQIIEI